MSELIDEIKVEPTEAQMYYNVSAISQGSDNTTVSINTFTGGTTRVARLFSLNLNENRNIHSGIASAIEYAIAALGGCVTIAFIYGCSTKAISFNSVKIRLLASFNDTRDTNNQLNRCPATLAYKISTVCNGKDSELVDVCKKVSNFSPNHRVFVEDNTICIRFRGDGISESIVVDSNVLDNLDHAFASSTEYTAPIPKRPKLVNVGLDWLHGTQIKASTFLEYDDNRDQTVSSKFNIDQPKQYLGFDYGPNPQEYLLSALTGELQYLTNTGLGAGSQVQITSGGHVDLRGITNAVENIPAKMDQLYIDVIFAGQPYEKVKNAVINALINSDLVKIIIYKNNINVSLDEEDRNLITFCSTDSGIINGKCEPVI